MAAPNQHRIPRLLATIGILLFLIPRIIYIARTSLSGDEAVFGLMAIEIGKGTGFPLYCWGAHYASALISYMAVPVMALLGPSAYSFKVTTLIFGTALVPVIYFSLRKQFDEVGAFLSTLVIALPLPILFEYSVIPNGGYPETYFLGFAIWAMTLIYLANPRRATGALLGFLWGASFMILWLGIPFIVSSVVLLLLRRRFSPSLIAGFAIGSLPFWVYNLFIAPGSTFLRLGARSLEATAKTPISEAILNKLRDFPEWISDSSIGLNSLFSPAPLIIMLVLITGAFLLFKRDREWGTLIITFILATIVFNWMGDLGRDRHWSPLMLGLVVAAHGFGRIGARLILVVLLVAGIFVTGDFIHRAEPDTRIAKAAMYLKNYGADALIADYDLGYPIGFELNGAIPVSATAPPNPSDRRPDWTEHIRSAKRPAIFVPNTMRLEYELAGKVPISIHSIGDRTLIIADTSGDSLLKLLQ